MVGSRNFEEDALTDGELKVLIDIKDAIAASREKVS